MTGRAFPEQGKSRDEVLAALTDHRARDLKSDGHAFAFVYDAGAETRELAREALAGWGFSPDEIATLEQAAAVKQA